jgi:hypothetical protein
MSGLDSGLDLTLDDQDPQRGTLDHLRAKSEQLRESISPRAVDELRAKLLGQEPPPQDEQEPQRDRYRQALDDRERGQDALLTMSLAQAARRNPQLAAEAQRLGIEFGMDPRMVERDIENVRRLSSQRAFENTLLTPVLRAKLLDPNFAAVAQDDIEQLGVFEEVVGALSIGAKAVLAGVPAILGAEEPPIGLTEAERNLISTTRQNTEVGVLISQRGFLGQKAMEGTITPEEQRQLLALERRMKVLPPEASGLVSGLGKMLGQMSQSLPEVIETAIAGGLGGAAAAAVAGQVGPQAVFPEEIATFPAGFFFGAKTAGAFAIANTSRMIEGGNAYLDLIEKGVDPGAARWIASTVGTVNGLLSAEAYPEPSSSQRHRRLLDGRQPGI